MRVVVVGAGLMGSQIGCEYALGGHEVVFIARDAERARGRVDGALKLAEELAVEPQAAVRAARRKLTIKADAAEVRGPVAVVIESVVEEAGAKIEVLGRAGRLFPDAILASNTSSLSITALGDGAGAPERTIGTHYWNPPLLMPLVEVVSGERTAPEVAERVTGTLRAMGKRPVAVTKDVPGFVWNRLQLALLREAVWLAEEGVASPAVVDEVVRDGLARRWRLTGPFETVAQGGPETFERIAANLLPELSKATALGGLRRWLDETPETLARVRQRRDEGLVEELRRRSGSPVEPEAARPESVEPGTGQADAPA